MLENKSGNISETRKDRGKVTMDGLYRKNLPTLFRIVLWPPLPRDRGLQLSYPLLSQEQVKLRTSNFVETFKGSIGTKALEKLWE